MANALTNVIHLRTFLWENAEQNPANRPMVPPMDAIRYRQAIKLTPFHAADPSVSAKTGKEDPTARSVHSTSSDGECFDTVYPLLKIPSLIVRIVGNSEVTPKLLPSGRLTDRNSEIPWTGPVKEFAECIGDFAQIHTHSRQHPCFRKCGFYCPEN